LDRAWVFYANDESGLFQVAQELGFDIQEVRPQPSTGETILQELDGAIPASRSDASTILLRALLSGPPDQRLADAILSFAARMHQRDRASRSSGPSDAQWTLLFLSADPMLLSSAVDYVCSDKGAPGAEGALEAVFLAAQRQRRKVITEEMIVRLIRECPQDILISALERTGDYLADRVPGLDKAFLAPDTPRGVRIALVRTLLHNDPAVRRIFDTSDGAPDSDFIEAALRRYATGGGRASIPHWLDVTQLAGNADLSPNARRAAIDVLQSLASSTSEKGKKAADALQRLAADPVLAPELRAAAADASLESASYRKDLEERERKWREESQRAENGQWLEEQINRTQEMLARADRGEISLSQDARVFVEASLIVQTRALLRGSLERLRVALMRYRAATEGRSPLDLNALRDKTGFETRSEIQYFPLADEPAPRVPAEVIVAIVELPTDERKGSPPPLGILFSGGSVQEVGRDRFVKAWVRGNSLRSSIGVPPIEPGQLGALARFLAPQSQPTQPSPTTTQSSSETQPSNVPRSSSQPRLRRG
jgi:hypothetical protein